MASANCWRCLSRTHLQSALPRVPSANFSTSRALLASAEPRAREKHTANTPGLGGNAKNKGHKTLRIKKKDPPVKAGKPPAPGERKAWRKRVVLSNTNALEVKGMREMDGKFIEDMLVASRELEISEQDAMKLFVPTEKGIVGTVVALTDSTVDSLRAVGAFKSNQSWELFRRPGLLIREESIKLSALLAAAEKPGGDQALRLVIDGARVTGKTLMLLHGMATAFLRGWVVINIAEGLYPFSRWSESR